MNKEKEYSKGWLPLVMSAVVVLLLLVMVVGGTWAHFETKAYRFPTLQYAHSEDEIYILSAEKDAEGAYVTDANGKLKKPEGWTTLTDENGMEIPGTYALHFLLANGQRLGASADSTQTVALTVFATQGVADPATLSIALMDNGSTYIAEPTEVQAGSAWHDDYGPGWTYRFYNNAGEELTWTLQGNVSTFREMTLTVSGAGDEPAMLTLLAMVKPTIQ